MPIRGAPRRVSAMDGVGVGAQMGSKGKTGAGGVYYADVVTGAAAKRSKRPASTRPLARPAWDSASSDLASMRRTPEAIPDSCRILNAPMEPVRLTCVPPHNSIETPGTSTTRTTSPYFSPNMAVAPAALASASGISSVSTA